jgi:hypothetical protein
MKATLAAAAIVGFFATAAGSNPGGYEVQIACKEHKITPQCSSTIEKATEPGLKNCFERSDKNTEAYKACAKTSCIGKCGHSFQGCQALCVAHSETLFAILSGKPLKGKKRGTLKSLPRAAHGTTAGGTTPTTPRSTTRTGTTKAAGTTKATVKMVDPRMTMTRAQLQEEVKRDASEQASAMDEFQEAQNRIRKFNQKLAARAAQEIRNGNKAKGQRILSKVKQVESVEDQVDAHLEKVRQFKGLARATVGKAPEGTSLLQRGSLRRVRRAPEDDLAKEMTHDLEMNFNKIAPFGKEDTARELQDHAAKTQDTLVDAVENAEVAEIKRAVFRALTRLRAATIKEFDTIARLETQAIDAYNDAHHYRAENPLAHLHEDEAPVETDKLKSFH